MSAVSNFFRDLFRGGGGSTTSSSSGGGGGSTTSSSSGSGRSTTSSSSGRSTTSSGGGGQTTTSRSNTIGSVSPQGTYAGDGFEWRDTGSGYLTRTYTGTNRGLGLGSEPIQAGGSDKPVKETIAQISLNEGSSYAYSPQSATDKSFLSLITTGDPGGSASYAAQVGAPTPARTAAEPAAPAKKTDFSSSGSFGQAFSAARTALGPGETFTYNGKTYTTATSEERPDLAGPPAGIQTLVPRDDRAPPGTYTGVGTQVVSDPRLNLPVGTLQSPRDAAIREQAALAQAASLYRPQESTGASTFQAQYGITPSEAMQNLPGFIGAGGPSDLVGRAADVALAQGVSPTRAGIGIEQLLPPPSTDVIPASPSRTGTPLRDQYFSPQGTQTTYLTPTVLQALPGNVQPIYEDVGIRFPLAGDTRFQRTAIGIRLPDGRVLQEGSPDLVTYLQNFGRMDVSEDQSVFRPYGYIGEPNRPFLAPTDVTQATVVQPVPEVPTPPVPTAPTVLPVDPRLTIPQLIAPTIGGGGGGGGGGGAPGTVVPIDPRLNIPVGGITSLVPSTVAPVAGVADVAQPVTVGQPGVYTPSGPTVGLPAQTTVETAYTAPETVDGEVEVEVGGGGEAAGGGGVATGGGGGTTGGADAGGGAAGGGAGEGEGVEVEVGGGGAGTGTGEGEGAGTGTGTGTGTGGGAGAGTGTGTGAGTGAGTGTGTGGGTGGGGGTGTGGGTGPGGTDVEVEVQEPVAEEPEPTFECPPGYIKQQMPNGSFTCVPAGLVRPTVGPYYQPQSVANLQGYRPISPGARTLR